MWLAILKPEIIGKHPKKRGENQKNTTYRNIRKVRATFSHLACQGGGFAPDRRQRVFNRGALQFCGGLCVCAGGLDIIKLTKIPLIYSVSRINLGGLGALIGGLSQPKPPRGDGTGSHACPPSITPLKKRCWSWRLNQAPVSEDAVVTIWLMLVTRRNSESAHIQRHLT